MKIKIVDYGEPSEEVVIDAGGRDVILEDVSNGVSIPTEYGVFGIVQCSSGIEVSFRHRIVWSSALCMEGFEDE